MYMAELQAKGKPIYTSSGHRAILLFIGSCVWPPWKCATLTLILLLLWFTIQQFQWEKALCLMLNYVYQLNSNLWCWSWTRKFTECLWQFFFLVKAAHCCCRIWYWRELSYWTKWEMFSALKPQHWTARAKMLKCSIQLKGTRESAWVIIVANKCINFLLME